MVPNSVRTIRELWRPAGSCVTVFSVHGSSADNSIVDLRCSPRFLTRLCVEGRTALSTDNGDADLMVADACLRTNIISPILGSCLLFQLRSGAAIRLG